MKLPRINCIHFDWGAGGKCNKLPKFLKYFRRSCPEKFNISPQACKLHEKHLQFDRPTPPPCRVYACYGSNMVRTKASIQADYEWECKLNKRRDT